MRATGHAVVEFYNSNNLTFAASIAYYSLLSLFPFLLLVFSILSRLAVGRSAAANVALQQIRRPGAPQPLRVRQRIADPGPRGCAAEPQRAWARSSRSGPRWACLAPSRRPSITRGASSALRVLQAQARRVRDDAGRGPHCRRRAPAHERRSGRRGQLVRWRAGSVPAALARSRASPIATFRRRCSFWSSASSTTSSRTRTCGCATSGSAPSLAGLLWRLAFAGLRLVRARPVALQRARLGRGGRRVPVLGVPVGRHPALRRRELPPPYARLRKQELTGVSPAGLIDCARASAVRRLAASQPDSTVRIERMPNRLARERSPYLLQHADNPVDWYAWGDEAFAARAREDKPIFLSIGYSTCHWCHVMEHESFEDEGDRGDPQRTLRADQGRSRGAAGRGSRLHDSSCRRRPAPAAGR